MEESQNLEDLTWYARTELTDPILSAARAAGKGAMVHALASSLGVPPSYIEESISLPSWENHYRCASGKFTDIPVLGADAEDTDKILFDFKGTLVAKIHEYPIFVIEPQKTCSIYRVKFLPELITIVGAPFKQIPGLQKCSEDQLSYLQEIFLNVEPL